MEKGRKRNGIFPILPYISTLVHIFIPFGLHSSRTLNPGRPITTWSAMKFPDGLRSFAGLRISGASSVGCDGTFRTPSVSGLTSCPSFSFSATSGVGGASGQLYLAVERGKFGLELLQLVLLLPHLARYLLQLRNLLFQHLVLRPVLVDGGGKTKGRG